jgi:hypothetical protein
MIKDETAAAAIAAFEPEHHADASVMLNLTTDVHAALKAAPEDSATAQAFGRLAQEIVQDGTVLIQLAAGDYAKIKAEITPPPPPPPTEGDPAAPPGAPLA